MHMCEDTLDEQVDRETVLKLLQAQETDALRRWKGSRNRQKALQTRVPPNLTLSQHLRYRIESVLPRSAQLVLHVLNTPLNRVVKRGPKPSNQSALLACTAARAATEADELELLVRHNNLSMTMRWQLWRQDEF